MPPVVAMAFFCACNSQGPAPSGMLQVVVASDPSVANELDHVDLQATQSGAVLLTVDEDVGPTGISLPASYEVRAAASNAAVAIHLVASHAGVAVLVRDAVTPVPSGVTVDVHLVLDSACLGSEEPRLDGGVASACADGLTCVQGACVSVVVPVGSLAGGSDASIATSDGSSTGRPDGASPNAACNGFDCFPSASGAMGSPLEGACTGSGTEACDGEPCGIQTRTCANGTWSDWGRCTRQGVCAPGDMQACGTNGVQTCGADCEWAAACGCPSGQTACTAGTCTTLASDVHDCGACGMDCALLPHVAGGSAACVAAVCTYACTSGYADCAGGGGGCTTSLASVSNCGGCGIPCSAASPVCAPAADASTGASNGGYACATGCTASAPTLCNGSCVNLQSSDANCGGCGKACASGVTCQAGVCVCTGASSEPCGNCGTETRTCNGDGSWSTWSACTGQGTCVPNATQTCDGNGSQTCTAACGWSSCTCNPGYTLCNGVCVNEAADDANCGGCGKACASGVTCQAGVC
ncbi:MAG TPA: hypothetical protein VK841_24930, partial [Polyangiaceae bacterium]|nr:hypothetical protein [Polyangiaceae bacterium]